MVALMLAAFVATSLSACAATQASAPTSEFEIVKGSGTDVCDAYLVRLNSTEWKEPPYCGRPESDRPTGFEILNRVPLADSTIFQLMDHVYNFTYANDQDRLVKDNIQLKKLGLKTRDPLRPLDSIPVETSRGVLRVWRYEPPIDIDNDEELDSLIVWHGEGASHGSYSCIDRRQIQLLYIVDLGTNRIDEAETHKLFWRPADAASDRGREASLVPIGRSMGVIKYKERYYFDTFFSGDLGDANGNRRDAGFIDETLALFEKRGSELTQRCEFRWNRSVSKWR